ncbi:hypothetical protein [Thiocapsa sp.]|uniref:hypothetical protein n=1 Tax=Thiocapsa sp. TaxID=2024551 RepID=UPI002C60A148|nr:hypothetical protein [Thiocapsa sp.]HSO83341.1 hypothetical protein [Thiocapsa sp.]
MSEPQGTKGRSRRWLPAPTIAGGIALVVYLALLLVTTWVAQERLSHSTAARHAHDAKLHANALSYFYAERLGDLANLRRDQVVHSFFVNRDPVDAAERARALLGLFAAPFAIEGRGLFLTGTLGIAVSPCDGKSASGVQISPDASALTQKESLEGCGIDSGGEP